MKIPPNTLLRLIRDRGMTPKGVAQALGVSAAVIYQWAANNVPCPRAKAKRLAARLSVEPTALGVLIKHPPPPQPRYPKRNAEMHRLRENGWRLEDIGKRYGLTREGARRAILLHCHATNAPPPVLPASLDLADAARLRQQGLSWRAVGERLGCDADTACRWGTTHAKQAGITLPKIVHPHAQPERNRAAYEMRLTGTTWTVIGKSFGIVNNPAQHAQGHARRHANRHNLPWPPKVTR